MPGIITLAHEMRVREDLMTLPGESWTWQRHAKEHLLHHDGHIRTLRRVIVMVAGALDTRICSEGQWPRPGVGLAAALIRRSLSSYHLTQGSSRIGVSKETADDTRWRGNAQGQERAPFQTFISFRESIINFF